MEIPARHHCDSTRKEYRADVNAQHCGLVSTNVVIAGTYVSAWHLRNYQKTKEMNESEMVVQSRPNLRAHEKCNYCRDKHKYHVDST